MDEGDSSTTVSTQSVQELEMLAEKVGGSLDKKPSADDIQEFNERMRQLAVEAYLTLPKNSTFEAPHPLLTYLDALSNRPGIKSPEEDLQSIPDEMQVDEWISHLNVTHLAFRGTDGSRIPVREVLTSYDLLRWEPCRWCRREDGTERRHPVLLGMAGDRVECQVIVCDKTRVAQHIYGK